MGCAICDYDPCMCGRRAYRDYEDEQPASVCRGCDCYPCMCGQNDFTSDRKWREEAEKRDRELHEDPMGPRKFDMDDY